MASSCVTSSGSPQIQNPGSHEVLLPHHQQVMSMDQRKRKRMQSNRESARRSRLRKQMHLEDLMNCICLLRKEKSQVLTSINLFKQHYLEMEAENSVLRAQLIELTKTLQSLKHICITSTTPRPPPPPPPAAGGAACSGLSNFSIRELVDDFILNHPWNMMAPNQYHPLILASAEMLDY